MAPERVRKTVSKSGAMNVEIEGVPYHSIYDPRREAQKFCNSYSIEKADVILQFGWGLGYCGEVLRTRIKPSARVIVFEPDQPFFWEWEWLHREVLCKDDALLNGKKETPLDHAKRAQIWRKWHSYCWLCLLSPPQAG